MRLIKNFGPLSSTVITSSLGLASSKQIFLVWLGVNFIQNHNRNQQCQLSNIFFNSDDSLVIFYEINP